MKMLESHSRLIERDKISSVQIVATHPSPPLRQAQAAILFPDKDNLAVSKRN
jgi:hypothetical protein